MVRSTWDHAPRREQFAAWAQSVPRLLNPPEVIRWNTDKCYLAQVPRAVSTEFVVPGQTWEPAAGEYVVKPTISAGSRDTARYGPGDEARARAHVAQLLSEGRAVMVQPYLAAVDDRGESALVFFAGEYSHAIRKGQMLRRGQYPRTVYTWRRTSARADRTLPNAPRRRRSSIRCRGRGASCCTRAST